jgi:hypothetical protein
MTQAAVADVDLDFICIKGECKKLLEDEIILNLLGTSMGRLFSRCCTRLIRASDTKKCWAIAQVGDILIGEPIVNVEEGSIADESEEEDTEELEEEIPAKRKQKIRNYLAEGHREAVNHILKKNDNNNKIPCSELVDIVKKLFCGRRILISQYGQKQGLTTSFRADLEKLASTYHVDIALALQLGTSGQTWLPMIQKKQPQEKTFPFMLSSVAGNILKNSELADIPGSYRIISYNSLQHTKKREEYKIRPSFAGISIKDVLLSDISRVLTFVSEKVTQKLLDGTYLR